VWLNAAQRSPGFGETIILDCYQPPGVNMQPEWFDLSWLQLAAVWVCCFLVGFTKTGVPGLGILIVPILAAVFPAGPSTGILLPMLIMGDVMAVGYYRRQAVWALVLKPLSWAAVGIIAAFLAIRFFEPSDTAIKRAIAILVLIILALGAWLRRSKGDLRVPSSWWFAALVGVFGGFTTMIANAAGPVWIIYLLALGLNKGEFLGTNAWIFLILNVFKVPFSMGLGFMTVESLAFNCKMFPLVFAGAVVGVLTAKYMPQRMFELLAWIFATAGSVKLLFF